MFFLLYQIHKGVYHKLGIVIAETPESAVQKIGKEIDGHMSKWDGLSAYYIKKTKTDGPEEALYILEHWCEISSPIGGPNNYRCNESPDPSKKILISCRLPKGHTGEHVPI